MNARLAWLAALLVLAFWIAPYAYAALCLIAP